ncbi:hypothetical protein LCGC14_0736000 [marine sediment metagenome]|uniref:Uncharacterized protein n=1 Tax=marine sediment metagenome TaxID=412755 RepID=A0A0F9TFD8_9ZZZZ
MTTFEIFDPRDGITLYTIKTSLLARLVIRFRAKGKFWDYAPKGASWTS